MLNICFQICFLCFFIPLNHQIAKYNNDKLKPTKPKAQSAYQEVYYGSQRTTLNQFFDEMLKKKIEMFSKKLGILEKSKSKKDKKIHSQEDSKIQEKEIFIERNENAYNDIDADLSAYSSKENEKEDNMSQSLRAEGIKNKNKNKAESSIVDVEEVLEDQSSFPSPTYKRNPKMAPRLIFQTDEEESSEANPPEYSDTGVKLNNYNHQRTPLNEIQSKLERFIDDKGMRSGKSDYKKRNTSSEYQLVNETNYGGM